MPETRIGAFGFYAATCTEPLRYGSADGQRACDDSWPGVAEGLCCFIQEDPLRELAGLSRFSYASSRPASATDPLGLVTYSYTLWANIAAGASGGFAITVAVDSKGNAAVLFSKPMGGGTYGTTVGASYIWSSAEDVNELARGDSLSVGASKAFRLAEKVSIGPEFLVGRSYGGFGYSGCFTIGEGPEAEIHGLWSNSTILFQKNILEILGKVAAGATDTAQSVKRILSNPLEYWGWHVPGRR